MSINLCAPISSPPPTKRNTHAPSHCHKNYLSLNSHSDSSLTQSSTKRQPRPRLTTLIKHTIPARKKTHHSTRRQSDTRGSYIRLPTMPASALAPHCMRTRTIAVLLLLSCWASAIPAEAKTEAECILKGWGRTGDGKGREGKRRGRVQLPTL